MKQTYVADVGDGLCMVIHTIFGKEFQIDCGSKEGSDIALNGFDRLKSPCGPDVFCLSHFHEDHYNGLLQASTNPRKFPKLHIRKVYYPRIPEFKERKEFLKALFAMTSRLFGDETGVMAYDLLRTIGRINSVHFTYRAVSKGDTIEVNGSSFEVLWPPIEISLRTLARIKKALKDFRKALEDDPELRRLYDQVAEEGLYEDYLKEEGAIEPAEYELVRQQKRRELPEAVVKANESLRGAANDLSLAFYEDNRLLFLGDLESHELKEVITQLVSKGRNEFYVFITPHHGTHWHNSLRKINCIYSVSSTGKRLVSNLNSYYKSISRISLCTHTNGDLVLPGFFGAWRGFLSWI